MEAPIPSASGNLPTPDSFTDSNGTTINLPTLRSDAIQLTTTSKDPPRQNAASLSSTLLTNGLTSQPGRTVESIVEAPGSSISVAPIPASFRHSRPGPEYRCGSGVFQLANSGEYTTTSVVEHFLPDVVPNSRPLCNRRQATRRRSQDMFLYYQNAGGMNSNIDDYRLAVSDRCFDVIVLTETWLDTRTLSNQAFGSEYEVFRCDRNPCNSRKSTGGGVLVAVGSGIKAKVIENESWKCLEQVWITLELADRKLFLCAVYFPPDRIRDSTLIEAHSQSIRAVMEIAAATDEVIVIGDFNLPTISWRPSNGGFLYPDLERSTFHSGAVKLLDHYSIATLKQINHVNNENHRCLDLCFVTAQDSAPPLARAISPLVKTVPHHPPLVITLEGNEALEFIPSPAAVFYDFRKADHDSIGELLSNLDWQSVLDPNDVNAAALTFSHILTYVIERHVPKKVSQHGNRPPWQTRELRMLKSSKRAAFRKYSKYRTLNLKDRYIKLNHEYQRTSRRCYRHYQRVVQGKLRSHPKTFWNYVNEQRKQSGLPSTMVLNDEVASSAQEISRLFSVKFASVYSDEILSNEDVSLAASNVPLFSRSLAAINVDQTTVIRAASQLKSSFKPGPDGVPPAFLKQHIDSLVAPLSLLYQMSLASGVFPFCWKVAEMFPVHKKGCKRNVDNYRGISSLCAISKLFELTVMEPLVSHFKLYLSEDQHGFTAGRSTTTNLLCLTSYISESMTDHIQTDVIYTDLSAAFDKLNHAIAIAKLDRLGITGSLLRWFASYISDRQLTVTIDDCHSPPFPATSGIPQGSHLGPLIFLVYFNDVNYVLDGPRLLYADDMKIYFRIRSTADCDFLQLQLNAFANWCHLNRMIVNPTKCSVITFARKKKPITYNYNLQGVEIQRVNHIKDLGVILDCQLTYSQHISYVVDKASRTLGFIFRIAKSFTDIDCLKSLYCSLVRSVLEYCCPVWNPNYQNSVQRLESIQRRFIRFALRRFPWRDPYRLPSYESRCQLIHLEPLWSRRDVTRALFVADILQGRIDCPSILQRININVRPRALRNNAMLRPPFHRTNYGSFGSINGLQIIFNRVASLFDFHLSREMLRQRFRDLFSRIRS